MDADFPLPHNTMGFVLLKLKLCTPRRASRFLHKHEVCVNKKRVFSLDDQIRPGQDDFYIDGKNVFVQPEIFLMMNKQKCRTCSKKDGNHATVYDDVPSSLCPDEIRKKLHTVGRLDADTEGLLLFTTDGTFSHKVSSPLHHVNKKYFVTLKDSVPKEKQIEITETFKRGIFLEPFRGEHGFTTKESEVEWMSDRECFITISEGKFHQIKRMFHAVSNEVVYLKRVSIGNLLLDEKLLPGESRALTDEEIRLLYKNK